MTEINLNWLISTYNEYNEKGEFFNNFFDKLAGSDKLRLQIIEGIPVKKIKESWMESLSSFRELREDYLLYK